MLEQHEINNIGFTIKPLIKELCDANVITQLTLSGLLKKKQPIVSIFLNRNQDRIFKKSLIAIRNIKDKFYKICIDSIEARKKGQKYIDIVDEIMVELEKLND
jgi:hypothetical protein